MPGMQSFRPVKVSEVVVPSTPYSLPQEKFLPTAVSQNEAPLPKEVLALIPKLVEELNKSNSVLDFGEAATTNTAQFADKMLSHVSMTNIGDFQKPLTEVLVLCSTVNAKSIQGGQLNSKIPFMNRMKLWFSSTKARAISNINSVKEQIDDIVKEVTKKEVDLRKNVDSLEDMYILNMKEYYTLVAHEKAVEQVMAKKKEELKLFIQNNQGSTDPLVSLEVSTRNDYITSLDRKLYDLRAVAMSCLNTAPMIRSEQRSSERAIEKFRNVRSMAIPAWKKQAVLMISSLENKGAAALGKTIDDTTNQMVRDNATAVSKNSVDTARLNERGILDIATLEYATEVLTNSIKEVMQIAEEGTQTRAQAAVKIGELKQSLNLNVVNKGWA